MQLKTFNNNWFKDHIRVKGVKIHGDGKEDVDETNSSLAVRIESSNVKTDKILEFIIEEKSDTFELKDETIAAININASLETDIEPENELTTNINSDDSDIEMSKFNVSTCILLVPLIISCSSSKSASWSTSCP